MTKEQFKELCYLAAKQQLIGVSVEEAIDAQVSELACSGHRLTLAQRHDDLKHVAPHQIAATIDAAAALAGLLHVEDDVFDEIVEFYKVVDETN